MVQLQPLLFSTQQKRLYKNNKKQQIVPEKQTVQSPDKLPKPCPEKLFSFLFQTLKNK